MDNLMYKTNFELIIEVLKLFEIKLRFDLYQAEFKDYRIESLFSIKN